MINEDNYISECKKYRNLKKEVKILYAELRKYRESKKPKKEEEKPIKKPHTFKLNFD